MKVIKNEIPKMNTMTDCVNHLAVQGYVETFQVNKMGLKALSDSKFYSAQDIAITNFYRFEGESDPADNAIIYVIETNDAKKGMLIDAFGMNADATISNFIVQVAEIQKKTNTNTK